MGRHPQPEIRERLLARCTDHVLAHGAPDRLAPFAEATGTSTRMLLYHFGTRDALLREVLQEARRRQKQTWGAALVPQPGEAYSDTLRRAWTVLAGEEGQQYLRLFALWRPVASGSPVADPRSATTDWLGPLADGLRGSGDPGLATLVLAVLRGLLMDLDATRDTERTTAALETFLRMLDRSPRASSCRGT